ncbi:phosphatase PAP2 family protein [Candidatus Bipolaricaulota bacterium]|nr:phosphatase PAP2 family protein [Candidatus Bipolaricaulota bacterium]
MEAEETSSCWTRLITRLDEFALWLVKQDEQGLERVSKSWITRKFSRYLVAATYFGDGYLWGMAGLVLILFGGDKGHNYVLIGLSISIVNIAVFRLIKTLMERPRPVTLGSRPLKYRLVDEFAFPSGHATVAFGIAYVFASAYSGLWWAWFGAYLASLIISLSRIFVREHYPSDVIGGAVIGTLVAAIFLPLFSSIVF